MMVSGEWRVASGKWRVARGGRLAWAAALAAAAGVMLAGCAQVKEKPALSAIQEELRQAAEQPKPATSALPPAVAAALAPRAEVKLDAAASLPLEPRFDLAVNNAPAQQVFLGIATGTRYSMLLHPEVAGNITANLKDVNVPEAMAAIRELYGYDYRMDGNRILVQPLTSQTRFYSIPYPTSVRQGKSELRVTSGSIADNSNNGNTSAANGTSSTSGGNATQLDSSRVETSSKSDFWGELKDSIALLIGCNAGTCPPDRQVMVSPHTGMLAVRALPKEQRQVAEYLKSARLNVERQVMIEAKIIEVSLNEGAQSGINWAYFNKGSSLSRGSNAGLLDVPKTLPQPTTTVGDLLGGGLPASGGATTGVSSNAGVFGLALQATNFMALLNFLETQGGVQVLSSPRIAAINNQKAVLKVGTDEFFVTNVSTTTNTGTGGGATTPNITLQPFFSGIALDVTPQIDDTGYIILHVHPSVSQVTTVEKNINLGSSTSIGNITLPLASSSISETDSIVRLKDGEIAAIGGLMKRASQDSKSGVPGLSDIPGLGALFRNDAASRIKHELVILLKPTVIKQSSDWMEGVSSARDRLSQ
jgi:MSHA biogenesis protein MshL